MKKKMIVWLGFMFLLLLILTSVFDLAQNGNSRVRAQMSTNDVVEDETKCERKYMAYFSYKRSDFNWDKAKVLDEVVTTFSLTRNLIVKNTILAGYNENLYRVIAFSEERSQFEVILESDKSIAENIEIKVVFFGPEGLFLESGSKSGFQYDEIIQLYK